MASALRSLCRLRRLAFSTHQQSSPDFFLLFGLQRSFDIDHSDLKRKYISLQYKLHPDRFAGANEEQKELAQRESALVSRAFEVMRDEYKRGQHLLVLLGHSSNVDDERLDADFLEEMMRLGEKVQSARADELGQMLDSVDGVLKKLKSQLSLSFSSHDWRECRKLLSQMKFYQSLRSSLVEKM